MNLPAIQHFAFDNFCYQLTDDDLEISINTGKDVDKVFIVAGDPFAAGILGGDWQWNGKETEITEKKNFRIITDGQQFFLRNLSVFHIILGLFPLQMEKRKKFITHITVFLQKKNLKRTEKSMAVLHIHG